MLPGTIYNAHEFQVAGVTGMCGPESLNHAESWAQQAWQSSLSVLRRCQANGDCNAQGVSGIPGLADTARKDGYQVTIWNGGTWRDFFHTYESKAAIVYLTANGQALVDSVSGLGEDATNLHGHILMIAGYHAGGYVGTLGSGQVINKTLPAGWWACDPDNWAVRRLACPNHVLQFYTDADLNSSQPVAAMALFSKGHIMALPTGWKDSGSTLTNPTNGNVVTLGFRTFILANPWDADDVPLANEAGDPRGGTSQLFVKDGLRWDSAGGVRRDDIGNQLAAANATIAALRQQLAGAVSLSDQQKAAIAAAEAAGTALSTAFPTPAASAAPTVPVTTPSSGS